MKFRSYDALRVLDAVAKRLSMTEAAHDLSRSKGAVSYQINKLEAELGFVLFDRTDSGLVLTDAGRSLWHVSQGALSQIDREVAHLRGHARNTVTVGALTYFAARWLSPRLTRFFEDHPGISLRIEPISSIEALDRTNVDLAILWGVNEWPNVPCERLLTLPSIPTANASLAKHVVKVGLENALHSISLLGDSSGDAGWRAWHEVAGLRYEPIHSALTIPDSNSRVQAVIDGQGLALWDDLVAPEFQDGKLKALTNTHLHTSGYFIIFPEHRMTDSTDDFVSWLRLEACRS